MIEIINGRVFWHEAYNNPPGLELLVSRLPKLGEHRFTQKGELYFSDLGGVCSFFSWDGRPDRGYGGATFTITMVDGGTKDLIGPWSSSPSAMNAAGFGPCTDAALTDEPATYERGYTFYAGAVTMELLGRFRDRIEVPPYRYSSDGTPWKGFDRRFRFPEGSRFTMLQTTPTGGSARTVRMDSQVSGQQGMLLGQMPTFVPLVELPGGGHWVKPAYHNVPLDPPEGSTIEELVPDTNEWMKVRSYVGGPKE